MTTDPALYGKTESHLKRLDSVYLHSSICDDYHRLCEEGKKQGFALTVASGFRSFDRQLAIWNGKAEGQRPVYDAKGKLLSIKDLSPSELMFSILHWSALPGASRHHWGTDFDLYDKAAVSKDYQLQLSLLEYSLEGPFNPMYVWLKEELKNNHWPFFFPYRGQSSIAEERWHLSHSVSRKYEEQQSIEAYLQLFLGMSNLSLRQQIVDNIEQIYHEYILV